MCLNKHCGHLTYSPTVLFWKELQVYRQTIASVDEKGDGNREEEQLPHTYSKFDSNSSHLLPSGHTGEATVP